MVESRPHDSHSLSTSLGDASRSWPATAETVRRAVAVPFNPALVESYRTVTAEHLPWVMDELEGVAEGAGVDAFAVFAASVTELELACTDLVAIPEVTADGHLLVAHNNDRTRWSVCSRTTRTSPTPSAATAPPGLRRWCSGVSRT
jgi:hypothetical protein